MTVTKRIAVSPAANKSKKKVIAILLTKRLINKKEKLHKITLISIQINTCKQLLEKKTIDNNVKTTNRKNK